MEEEEEEEEDKEGERKPGLGWAVRRCSKCSVNTQLPLPLYLH